MPRCRHIPVGCVGEGEWDRIVRSRAVGLHHSPTPTVDVDVARFKDNMIRSSLYGPEVEVDAGHERSVDGQRASLKVASSVRMPIDTLREDTKAYVVPLTPRKSALPPCPRVRWESWFAVAPEQGHMGGGDGGAGVGVGLAAWCCIVRCAHQCANS